MERCPVIDNREDGQHHCQHIGHSTNILCHVMIVIPTGGKHRELEGMHKLSKERPTQDKENTCDDKRIFAQQCASENQQRVHPQGKRSNLSQFHRDKECGVMGIAILHSGCEITQCTWDGRRPPVDDLSINLG